VSDVDASPDAGGTTYPPEPWHLAGLGHLTTWRVDAARLPALPTGVRPATARGRALAVTAFVDYRDSGPAAGMMAYHELLAALVVRHGRGLALSITDIVVDSEVSRAGGRGLWGIPKELARFDGLSATDSSGPMASATFLPLRVLGAAAVPLPTLGSSVLQTLHGSTVATSIRAAGRVRLARATWTFPSSGPLAWLRGARPVVSATAAPFRLTFGSG
jgi:hypothetical protein